jgi:hypothetical protein
MFCLKLLPRLNLKAPFKQFVRSTKPNNPDLKDNKDQVEIVSEQKTIKLKKQTPKTINIESSTTEEIKIKPYFSTAVSEKAKSHTNISVSSLIEEKKSKTKKQKEDRKKQQEQKKTVIIENIKRELPKEL